jgi:hypothetical protein
MEEHHEKLTKVREDRDVIQEVDLKLNLKKCVWRQPQATFLGHKFGKDGVCLDPAKVKAIVDMLAPTNVKELQQIRRMINYLYIGMFIPNLATIMKPKNDLLKKDVLQEEDRQLKPIAFAPPTFKSRTGTLKSRKNVWPQFGCV